MVNMKKLLFILLLIAPITCMGQMLGVGAQWTEFEKIQFNATASYPYKTHLGDNFCWMLSGGVDYVGGSSTVSGLNVKPASFMITTSDFFALKPVTISLGCDAGYNFGFKRYVNDGIILSPNIYFDYKTFYIKAGYDYNTFENEGQFFVKFGIGLGQGFIKMLSRKFN
jgi:hypothetical protein